MRLRPAPLALILLSACAGVVDGPPKPDRQLVRTPEGLHEFFAGAIAAGEYGDAYRILSQDARARLREEEFVAAFVNFEPARRMIAESRLVESSIDPEDGTGYHRLVNPEFGLDRGLRIVREHGVLWTYDLTQADIDHLVERTWAWFDRRTATYDHRRHAFPRGWVVRPPPGGP